MRRLALLPAALLAVATLARAHPHSIPSVWTDLTVADEAVRAQVTLQVEVLAPWLGRDAGDAVDSAWLGRHRWRKVVSDIEALLADVFTVRVESRALRPRIVGLAIDDTLLQADGTEYVRIEVAWPFDPGPRPPGRIEFSWSRFDLVADGTGEQAVPYTLVAGGPIDDGRMSRAEPGFTWHRPRERAAAVPLARARAVGPRPTPWLALGLFVAGVAALVVLGSRPVVATCAGSLLVAAALHVPRPAPRLQPPTPVQARRIFETLHDNVYRAFGAESEDGIYELLRASVDAGVLDRMYGDVYESLLMRDQGGAFSRVEEVARTDGDVVVERRALRFRAEWSWRVRLVVTHWGHAHRRVDAYRGAYDVVHDGESWKIAGVDILDRKRVPE